MIDHVWFMIMSICGIFGMVTGEEAPRDTNTSKMAFGDLFSWFLVVEQVCVCVCVLSRVSRTTQKTRTEDLCMYKSDVDSRWLKLRIRQRLTNRSGNRCGNLHHNILTHRGSVQYCIRHCASLHQSIVKSVPGCLKK
jgi:hypothetical protein